MIQEIFLFIAAIGSVSILAAERYRNIQEK